MRASDDALAWLIRGARHPSFGHCAIPTTAWFPYAEASVAKTRRLRRSRRCVGQTRHCTVFDGARTNPAANSQRRLRGTLTARGTRREPVPGSSMAASMPPTAPQSARTPH
ncbi:hypothetical protein EX530_17420 [Xanthomonas phaseoli]